MSALRCAISATLISGVAVFVRDAGACSCMPPEPTLLSPTGAEGVPANAKVRVEMPSYRGASVQPVLRIHDGASVDTKVRKIGGQTIALVELTPVVPLEPDTRYEIATIDPERHPPNHVLGTFKTAKTVVSDTTAPRIDRMGAVFAERTGQIRTSCSVPGPWIVANDLAASDPGRPSAQLVYGVWLGDNTGNVDTTKPPTRILGASHSPLVIGQSSSCHFHDFPIPTTPFACIGIAAIDEAGNQSAVKKVRVDLAGAKSP
jgi:hypothetical protein